MAIGQYPVGSHTVSGGVASSGLKFYIQKASKYCIHTAQIIAKSCSYYTDPLVFDRLIIKSSSYIIQEWIRRYHITKSSAYYMAPLIFDRLITKSSSYIIQKWIRHYTIIKGSTHKNKFFTGIITKLSNYRIKL